MGQQAQYQHHHQASHLRGKVDQHHALLLESAYRHIYLGGLETPDGRRQPGDRQYHRQYGRGIGRVCWPKLSQLRQPSPQGQQQGKGKQQETADDLHGPGGIEKIWIVTTVALDDVLAQAHIGKQMQQYRNSGGNDHHAEHFRQQQAGHDQIAAQAHHL
ncbi:hypothetical protein D9M73_161720 [compost metagenome]